MSSRPLDRRPPSPRWYRVAALVFVAGIVAAGAWWPYATTRVYDEVETFQRISPFGGSVELTDPGTHTFWIEGNCITCHDNNPHEYRAAATAAVEGPTGRQLALRAAPPRLYNTARREGRALWLFDADQRGTYRVSLDFDTTGNWDNTPPGNIAIGSGAGLGVGIVRPMMLAAAGSALAAVGLLSVTWARRRRYFAGNG